MLYIFLVNTNRLETFCIAEMLLIIEKMVGCESLTYLELYEMVIMFVAVQHNNVVFNVVARRSQLLDEQT